MAQVIKAPNRFDHYSRKKVFLAGSMAMGTAPDWRSEVVEALKDENIVILDPWRDDWDSSWEQRAKDDNFREQVEWELDGLEDADVVLVYFAPGTSAPISLFEFGLLAQRGKTVVCSDDGFWRYGNIKVVCDRYGIPLTGNLDDAALAVKTALRLLL